MSFQPDRGAPPSVTLDKLISWSDSTDAGVKYFSGAGTYTKTIQAPADWFRKGSHLWIDLGDVKNLAEVTVNGKSLGVVWHTPYRVDVTSALKPGANEVSIKVINAWVNRLIGDRAAGRNQVHLRRRAPVQSQLAAAAFRACWGRWPWCAPTQRNRSCEVRADGDVDAETRSIEIGGGRGVDGRRRPTVAARRNSMPVIDAHIHLFDPTRPGGVPWPEKTDTTLYRPALPPRYAQPR